MKSNKRKSKSVRKSKRKSKRKRKRKRRQRGGRRSMREYGESLKKWANDGKSRLRRYLSNEHEPEVHEVQVEESSQSDKKVNIVLYDIRDVKREMIYDLIRKAWLKKYEEHLPGTGVKIDSMKMVQAIRTEDTDIPKKLHRWSECEHRYHTGKKHQKSLSWNDQRLFKRGPQRNNKGHHCGRCGRPICLEHQSTGAGSVSFAPSTGHALPSKWCHNCVDNTAEARQASKRDTNTPSHKEFGLPALEQFGRKGSNNNILPGTVEFWEARPTENAYIELPKLEEWDRGGVPPDIWNELSNGKKVTIRVEVDTVLGHEEQLFQEDKPQFGEPLFGEQQFEEQHFEDEDEEDEEDLKLFDEPRHMPVASIPPPHPSQIKTR